MRKIITLILTLSIIMGIWCLPHGAEAAENTENKATLLYNLGVISEDIKTVLLSDTGITRAQFAELIFKAARLNAVNDISFNDIDAESPYYEAICAVSGNRIMMGDGNGNFNPDSYVTELDAMICVLRILGYEEYSKFYGGYPTGYHMCARKTNILDGVGEVSGEDISGSKLSYLIKNMLNEPVYEVVSVSGSTFDKRLTEQSFLYLNYKINKFEGIVTGNTQTLINAVKETGGIIIDGMFIPVVNSVYDIYIGMHCEAYYNEDTTELIYMEETEKNKVQIITSEMIKDVRGTEIIYEKTAGKENTISFPSDAYILYNGRFLNHYSESLIENIKTGEIRFIDNNRDGKTEVVSVYSYETYVIDSVSAEENLITFKYGGGTLAEKDIKDISIYGKNGLTDIDWLHEWEVLNVLKDESNNVTAIYASGSVERKKPVEIVIGEDAYITFSDGKTAKIHPDASDRLKEAELNAYNVFSFDMFGNVITYTKEVPDKICVIISTGESSSFDPELMVKLYTDDEEIIVKKVNGNIHFNGISRKMDKKDDYDIVKNELEKAKGELAEIRIGTDGEIDSISIMEVVYDSGGASVTAYLNAYTCAVIPTPAVQYFIKKTANAFYIPKNLTGVDEKDFIVKNVTKCGAGSFTPIVYKRRGSTDIDADAVAFKRGGGFDTMGEYNHPMLVSDITNVYVEEEEAVYTKLTYWHNGTEKTAIVKDEDKLADIDKGDICWIDVEDGEIIGIVKYFDYSENKDFPPETSTPKSYTSVTRMLRGHVVEAYEELYKIAVDVKLTTTDEDGNKSFTESQMTEFHRYPIYGYVFESTKGGKIRKANVEDYIGSEKDSVNYSRIFVHSSYTTDYFAVIYK